ncbi:MAG: LamG domain-containing protein, partial [Phormidesmis sp.]
LPVEEESPAEEELPVEEESPAEEELPVEEESPAEEELPVEEGSPVSEEPSVEEAPPYAAETPASPDIDAEPIVALSFEEALGRIAQDTATAGVPNNGKLYGGAEWTDAGKVGGAIALDGRNDLMMLNSSPDLNLGNAVDQRTVAMWFNAAAVDTDKAQVIFEAGGLFHGGMNIYLEDDLLYFGAWSGAENNWQGSWLSTDEVTSGKWHHVAVVLDAPINTQSGADGTLTAYLDGQAVGQTTGVALQSHPDPIGLGNVSLTTRFENGYGFLGNSGLAGAIDEVQVFNDALSGQQVRQLTLV